MQEISKISVDLLFCLIISFLIIQSANPSQQNPQLTSILNTESARISANNNYNY